MSKKFLHEAGDIVLGAAAIELSPEMVGGTLNALEQGGLSIPAQEMPQIVASGIELAQGLVLPAATLLLMWAGLKEMFSGFSNKKS